MSTAPATDRKATWARQQLARQVLEKVAKKLDRAGIPWVPVKGVILAEELYSDPTERDYGDVDLLVDRAAFAGGLAVLRENGWELTYLSHELGEIACLVDNVPFELHAEVGRRDLTGMMVTDVIRRSTWDDSTFGFRTRRLDDLDHVLLLAANVVKDWFVQHKPHHAEDLGRLLLKLAGHESHLVARAEAGGFRTGLFNVARWLVSRADDRARALLAAVAPPSRKIQPFLAQITAKYPTTVINFAVASMTNDVHTVRARALERIVRRGLWRSVQAALRYAAEPLHESSPLIAFRPARGRSLRDPRRRRSRA